MPNTTNIDELLCALSDGLSDEEILLSLIQSEIAAVIASARIEKGLSQKDLARELHVSQALVSRWENGETNYTIETLVRIAVKLGIKMNSPFEVKRAPRYEASAKIISFPTNNWSAASYSSSNWSGELKEM